MERLNWEIATSSNSRCVTCKRSIPKGNARLKKERKGGDTYFISYRCRACGMMYLREEIDRLQGLIDQLNQKKVK